MKSIQLLILLALSIAPTAELAAPASRPLFGKKKASAYLQAQQKINPYLAAAGGFVFFGVACILASAGLHCKDCEENPLEAYLLLMGGAFFCTLGTCGVPVCFVIDKNVCGVRDVIDGATGRKCCSEPPYQELE